MEWNKQNMQVFVPQNFITFETMKLSDHDKQQKKDLHSSIIFQ